MPPDRVHLFLSLTPPCSLSGATRLLKCNSARRRFDEFPRLRKRRWSGHLWPEGKFYRSIGNVTAEAIQHYIASSEHK